MLFGLHSVLYVDQEFVERSSQYFVVFCLVSFSQGQIEGGKFKKAD